MALCLPVLVGMLLAIASIGASYTNKAILTHAGNAAAAKASTLRGNPNPAAACIDAARSAAAGLKQGLLTVTCSSQWLAGSQVIVKVTYPYTVQALVWHKTGTMSYTTTDTVR